MSLPHKIGLGLLLLLAALSGLGAGVQVGDVFPALPTAATAGAEPPAVVGQITLVDFWASWCAPCKESFRSYAQMHADYRSRGLVIVAVGVDEKQEAFDAFVKKIAPPFIVVRDKDQQLVRQVKVPAMPTCYLIGRDGRVRFMHQGFFGAETDRLVRKEIDSLLAEKSPAS